VAAVVAILTVPVALAVELRVTVEPVEAAVHVGNLVAPEGDVVSAQVRVTAPRYAVVVLTVMVDVAEPPAVTAAGGVAASV
jgi:hypothetical protein